MQVSWLAILFVLISLAVTALEETDPILRDLARGPEACTNIRLLSKRYREAAMQCLAKQGVLWGRHNVQSLQALVLLLYAMGHSQDHTWVLLGRLPLYKLWISIVFLITKSPDASAHRLYSNQPALESQANTSSL